MFKIGILGSDNSHADRYAEVLNRPDHAKYLANSGAQIISIWGQEMERTAQVAQNGNIATIVAKPEDMIGQVDAVFCVARHGGLHRDLVTPYLEAGIPTFVDKPLAVDPADARAIVALAKQRNVPLISFSNFRFSAHTLAYLSAVQKLGDVRAGVYAGPASRRNSNGGIIFFASHCIELMLLLQGSGVQSVHALEATAIDEYGNGNVIVMCAWGDGKTATMQFTVDAHHGFRIMSLGRAGAQLVHLNTTDCYHEGMKQILPCLRGETKSSVTPEAMIEAVDIGAAVARSLDEKRQVTLAEFSR